MTTISVELDDALYERLAEQARAQQLSVPDFLARLAKEWVEPRQLSDPAAKAAEYLRMYPTVFARLAE
ncbi:MAG: ribbon-helix-helix protein, CopG family [Chloroflexi bacterium]|nr:ribbon-helix-helix protein, CopG family [Chloroflexota bacterium]